MDSRVFLGMHKEKPVYYCNKLRSGIACTVDNGKILDYSVIVNDLEQAILAVKLYGQFSFKIR